MDLTKVNSTLEVLFPSHGEEIFHRIEQIIDNHKSSTSNRRWSAKQSSLSERDITLITYADQVYESGYRPLVSLRRFLDKYLKNNITSVHILPFYPYSSDDGFSVIDYKSVSEDLGNWGDVQSLGESFHLMLDAVINHVSIKHQWFQSFLNSDSPYENYFIQQDSNFDIRAVTRPRSTPLFHSFETKSGSKQIWTTFSRDQVDLNFKNSDVVFACIDVLLFYAQQGASIIRLDAIGYIWKETGTSCLNLSQAHLLVKIFRSVLHETYPHVQLITETNVPHEENIAYFGNGQDEAQMVYQFSLAPLVLYSFLFGNALALTQWATDLEFPETDATVFNFLASHDGIGVLPARGFLSDEQIENMVEKVNQKGGLVSYRDTDKGKVTYEINATWLSAIADPDELLEIQIKKVVTSYAIAMCMKGVPGIYIHSIFGTPNDMAGYHFTGHARTVNRRRLRMAEVETALETPTTMAAQIFTRMQVLFSVRTGEPLFHPRMKQIILHLHESVFALIRSDSTQKSKVICLHNVSSLFVDVMLDVTKLGATKFSACNLVTNEQCTLEGTALITLQAYDFMWLKLTEK